MKKSFLKTKTVHGLKTGNHSNPNVLRAARASGGSCMVEGASARPSMSKPKMMRADGGGVQISEDSKAKAKELRDSAKEMPTAGLVGTGVGMGTYLAHRDKYLPKKTQVIGKLGGAALTALGVPALATDMAKSRRQLNEADSIERGEAIPGKEDRKNGGGIMPRFKAKKTDKDDC